jgi:type II secretory pathway predicted ATPase ExeA
MTSMNRVFARYGIIGDPFSKEVDPEDFFVTDDLTLAATRLKASLEGRAGTVITGDSGTGKTVLWRAVEDKLPPGQYRIHYLANSMVNHRDFYRQLSMTLGLEARATAAALFAQVSQHIAKAASEHRMRTILVLDEAHLFPHAVLSHLHILLNFERDSKPWLTLVLIGLPELKAILARDVLKSLSTRMPTRIAIKALDAAGVREYVTHRLAKAGARSQIFAEDAVLLLAEATGGVMRKIDTVAWHSLVEAMSSKGTVVDHSAVARAVEACKDIL